jgi:HAD superfamily hydrolase (TIGR01549 family)
VTSLVTFDFHNTIARCDAWFDLEIRDLPVRTLEILAPSTLDVHSPDGITASYRSLREQVMASGREVDAVEGVRRVTDALGVRLAADDIATAIETLMRKAAAEATPIPGAVESIRAIAENGARVGVISSAVYHPFLEWTLERFGVDHELAFIMTSASTGVYKSNPDIYRMAMDAAGALPEASVHVGDSEKWDVWAAKEAGMRAVWFAYGTSDPLVDREMETEPDHTVHHMGDVAPWVLSVLERHP